MNTVVQTGFLSKAPEREPAEHPAHTARESSVDRRAEISRHFFCITNIFVGLHIFFICNNLYKKGKEENNMIKSTAG